MQVLAFEATRPTTNLTPDKKYALSKAQMRSGFMGVFRKEYVGDARRVLLKIALAPMMSTMHIDTADKFVGDKGQIKEAKKAIAEWESNRNKQGFARYTELQKVNDANPHFILRLPIVRLQNSTSLTTLNSLFSATPVNDNGALSVFLGGQEPTKLYPAAAALQNSGLPAETVNMFGQCLNGVVYNKSTSGFTLVSLEFKITEPEAEAITSVDWLEMRAIDLYPLFAMWVAAEYVKKDYGKSAISISKIASTLPAHLPEDVRVDKFGVGIDLSGRPIFIPEKCDNTAKYEQQFADVGQHPDGSFKLADINSAVLPPLPANIPVLTDWVNYKFSYTNSSGHIVTTGLEHVRKCTASMAVNILHRPLDMGLLTTWVNLGTQSGLTSSMQTYMRESDIQALTDDDSTYFRPFMESARNMGIDDYVKKLTQMLAAPQTPAAYKVPRLFELTGDATCPIWYPLARFVDALGKSIRENLDAMFVKYAVQTIMSNLGYIALIAGYGKDMATTRMDANTTNKACTDQGVDPTWTPPAAPLLTEKFSKETGGLLPHQAKVRNLLRESPDFAVLSVDAGGGKSMLAITDVLYEIKAKRNAPYLIMCPSHLVANYVSELVEFTDGKVNVIPVTSYNIRTTGHERYAAILKTAPINTVLVVDYDALKFRAQATVYGTSSVEIYPVIELVRQFQPKYCFLDECHFLKNAKSARYKAVMTLIADIPKKRIASGTINPDSPSDLPGQIAIMDPTVFGTRDEFNATFGQDVKGGRVRSWKPSAGAFAIAKLKNNMVWTQAKRKEWASALPPRKDSFRPVELSPAQRAVYDALFDDMVQSIKRDAQHSKSAKRLLDQLNGKKASKEDEDSFGDLGEESTAGQESKEDLLDDERDIGGALQPYLAAIELFVTDPASHPYALNGFVDSEGNHIAPLKGDDLISPKVKALIDYLNDYLSRSKSKVIVFVNYNASAAAVYNSMPDNLKANGMLYTASQKTEMVNRFKTDPSVRWMVGIRKSLEVGLNLQCFPGHTQVLLDKGRSLSMAEIYASPEVTHVLSYNLKTKKIEPKRILNKMRHKVKRRDEYVSIRVRDNLTGIAKNLVVTSEHNIFLKNGEEVCAEDLKAGDQLITFGGDFDRWKLHYQTGSVMPAAEYHKFACNNQVCEICGERMANSALIRHMADVHGETEQFENWRSKVSSNTKKEWEENYAGRYLATLEGNEKQSSEFRAEYVKRGWANDDGSRRAKLSASTSANWADPEYKKRVGKSIQLGLAASDFDFSSASAERWEDPAFRNAVVGALTERMQSPEGRAWASKHFKALWADEDMRARFLESQYEVNQTEERRAKRVAATKRLHAEKPGFTDKGIQAMLNAQFRNPSRPEQQVMGFGIDNLEYTGMSHARYWVSLTFRGKLIRKNPDFISLNHCNEHGRTCRVVEVIGAREWTGRDAKYDRDLIKAYKKAGIECMIIDADDLKKRPEHYEAKLQSFVNNHYLTVEFVKPYTNENTIGEYKYDLTVEDNENYFACAGNNDPCNKKNPIPVLVHNCAGSLVRMEGVWNPGEQEQGDSRIARPYFGPGGDKREALEFVTFVADRTIDVTKAARLRAKMVALAKFENTTNPAYEAIDDIPVFSMTLNNILDQNDFSSNLIQYADSMRQLNQVIVQEYADYRRELEAQGGFKFTQVETAPTPPECALLSRTPYAQGTELYSASELGMVRVDNFLGTEMSAESEDESEDTTEETGGTENEAIKAQRGLLMGRRCHTEYGDGIIVGAFAGGGSEFITRLRVKLDDGTTVNRVRATNVFVITREYTNGIDMRNKLAEAAGLKVTAPITVPGLSQEQTKITKKQLREEERQREEEARQQRLAEKQANKNRKKLSVTLNISLVNGYLRLAYSGSDGTTTKALQALGFKADHPYVYTRIRGPKHLIKQATAWANAGFEIHNQSNNEALQALAGELAGNGMASHKHYSKLTSQSGFANYLRKMWKPIADKKILDLFALVTDGGSTDRIAIRKAEKEGTDPAYGIAYLCMPSGAGFPATKLAMAAKFVVPGTRWVVSEPAMAVYAGNIAGINKVAQALNDAGISIANVDELKEQARNVKHVKPKLDGIDVAPVEK